MTEDERRALGLGEPRFLLFGGDDTHGVIDDFATLDGAVAVVVQYRLSPEMLPKMTDDELAGIDELIHGVEFLGTACPYRNHGNGRDFYVTHFNYLPGFEPEMPEIVVNI